MGTKRGKMRTLTCASCGESKAFRGFMCCENCHADICMKCQKNGCQNCEHKADDDPKCPDCKGSGRDGGECETCSNNGWVYDPSDGGTMCCPDCEDCRTCCGSGNR